METRKEEKGIAETIINALIEQCGIDKVKELVDKAAGVKTNAVETSKEKEMEEFLLEKWKDMEIITKPQLPNSIFYKKDGAVIMEQDKKNDFMWVSYEHIWSVFYTRYELDYNQTQAFIKRMMRQHLKLESLTPLAIVFTCNP